MVRPRLSGGARVRVHGSSAGIRETLMRSLKLLGCGTVALGLACAPSTAQEAQPEDLVNALNGVFGAHAKMRGPCQGHLRQRQFHTDA